ncbi:hypothetical protein EDC96DRAFT_591230 [Choanephora cucurbitarum]|nr:hypothetical protein EDC96DRAFT_591230 [Choanephora cucurbitarum]
MGKKGSTVLVKPTKDHLIEAMAKITGEAEAEAKHSMLHDICFGIVTNTIDTTCDAKEALSSSMDAFCNNWMIKRVVVSIYENKVRYFNSKTAKKGKKNAMPVPVEKGATDKESGESDEGDKSTDEAKDEGQATSSKRQNNDPSSASNFKRGRKRHLKKYENKNITSSDYITKWHELCRTKQEIVLLEEEQQRLY